MPPCFLPEVSKQLLLPDIKEQWERQCEPYSKIILSLCQLNIIHTILTNESHHTYHIHCLGILVCDKHHLFNVKLLRGTTCNTIYIFNSVVNVHPKQQQQTGAMMFSVCSFVHCNVQLKYTYLWFKYRTLRQKVIKTSKQIDILRLCTWTAESLPRGLVQQ
jgi:hypothetical protein